MCARCAAKASAKAPTLSHTVGSTLATGHSAAHAVSMASSAGLNYNATKRRNVVMETFTLRIESNEVMSKVCEVIFVHTEENRKHNKG